MHQRLHFISIRSSSDKHVLYLIVSNNFHIKHIRDRIFTNHIMIFLSYCFTYFIENLDLLIFILKPYYDNKVSYSMFQKSDAHDMKNIWT